MSQSIIGRDNTRSEKGTDPSIRHLRVLYLASLEVQDRFGTEDLWYLVCWVVDVGCLITRKRCEGRCYKDKDSKHLQ
jgi:hypothetical protein